MNLTDNMLEALRAMPLVRLHGGWWVEKSEGIEPRATKTKPHRKVLAGVDTHRTNTVKALMRRDLVTLENNYSPYPPDTGNTGTTAHLTDKAKEILPGRLGQEDP